MAPAKTGARSRRTQSYSWSSDSGALRPVYQWPEVESASEGSDGAQQRTSPSGSSDEGVVVRGKGSYDSDSCLTPRSRRTLRRTLEPWPSVGAPAKPALDTIYSPSHEILHPMQSLLLEKSLSADCKPKPTLAPVRRTMSEDFDSRRRVPKPSPFQFESKLHEEDEPTLKTDPEDEQGLAPDPKPTSVVVIIVDAEKKLTKFAALDWAINAAVVQPGDEIVVLGVLKHISSPMGYKVVADTDPLVGANPKLLQSEVKKTTEVFEQKLSDSGRRAECEKKNVKLTVRIAPGARARTVVVRELAALNATYAVFDRRLMRGRRYYGKHLSCHAVRMRSNGRSIKTIFTMKANSTAGTSPSTESSSPTSDASNPSPTYFWRRFTAFRSSRTSRTAATTSPRSSTASSEANVSPSKATDLHSLNLDSFMSEMQDFSISLDRTKDSGSKLALQSCVVADAYSYKQGMDSHRIKHRPISVTIPPICAT